VGVFRTPILLSGTLSFDLRDLILGPVWLPDPFKDSGGRIISMEVENQNTNLPNLVLQLLFVMHV
jgi:hypothetical protein